MTAILVLSMGPGGSKLKRKTNDQDAYFSDKCTKELHISASEITEGHNCIIRLIFFYSLL